MKEHKSGNIRNVAIVSQAGSGKTTLAEALIYNAGVTDRLGKVDEGTSNVDFDPEEVERRVTINTKILPCEWKDCKVNLLDTPGYGEFIGEVEGTVRVVDGMVVVIDAPGGIDPHLERVYRCGEKYHLPGIAFINKMDKEGADFKKTLAILNETLGKKFLPLQIPLGEEKNFRGVIDLLQMKARIYQRESGKFKEEPIPEGEGGVVEELRETLVEAVAEMEDALVEKYLEGEEISPQELVRAMKKGVMEGKFIPTLCGSALLNMGCDSLLDSIVGYLPSPQEVGKFRGKNPRNNEDEEREATEKGPFVALVFKTISEPHLGALSLFRVYGGAITSGTEVYNSTKGQKEKIGQLFTLQGRHRREVGKVVAGDIAGVAKLRVTTTGDTLCDASKPLILEGAEFSKPMLSLAVKPRTRKDEEKLTSSLNQLVQEDPTLEYHVDKEFGQTILSGMGELHLDILINRLKKRFGVEVDVERPRVAYRETIRSTSKAQGKYKRQSGGRGQYGDCWLELEPLPRGQGYEFVSKIVGGAIPSRFIPAVEKGVKEAMKEGVVAGYPVTDMKITVCDGSFHPVDSSDIAFQIAGSMAFKKGMEAARPVLLEPIVLVEVIVPPEYLGEVNGDLNSRRGRIVGIENRGGKQVIKAQVPLAEMFRYASDLKSMTRGSGIYSMEFSHYEEVPEHISKKIIAESSKTKKAEDR